MDKSKYEKQLTSVIKSWNKKQHDIIIYCDPFFEQYSPEQFQDKIDFYNKTYNKRDVYFMGFHPETPADPNEQQFLCDPTEEPVEHSELEYSMMLIQKFKQFYDASYKLHKIGYYEKWPKEYYEEVVAERQHTYEQLNKKEVITMMKKKQVIKKTRWWHDAKKWAWVERFHQENQWLWE